MLQARSGPLPWQNRKNLSSFIPYGAYCLPTGSHEGHQSGGEGALKPRGLHTTRIDAGNSSCPESVGPRGPASSLALAEPAHKKLKPSGQTFTELHAAAGMPPPIGS